MYRKCLFLEILFICFLNLLGTVVHFFIHIGISLRYASPYCKKPKRPASCRYFQIQTRASFDHLLYIGNISSPANLYGPICFSVHGHGSPRGLSSLR